MFLFVVDGFFYRREDARGGGGGGVLFCGFVWVVCVCVCVFRKMNEMLFGLIC